MSDSIDDRITALEAQLAALRAEVRPSAATGDADPESDEVVARRSLLRKTGVAIAGVAAGGYVLTQASPAGAANGDPIEIGSALNTGTLATELRTTGTPRVMFLVNGPGGLLSSALSEFPAALAGWGADGSYGVYAWSNDTPGLVASSGGSNVASVQMKAHAAAAPTSGAHVVGELQMLTNGRLSVCSVAGTPGTWSSVGLTPLTPARFLDTRSGVGLLGKQGAGDANVRNLTVAGTTQSGTTVPASARAIAANITVTNPTSGGFLTVWNTGATRPDVSNVNFTPGLTVANFAILPLGTSGQISFFNAFGDTDVLLDISGYFL
jgi:hypothetical protein